MALIPTKLFRFIFSPVCSVCFPPMSHVPQEAEGSSHQALVSLAVKVPGVSPQIILKTWPGEAHQ